MSIKFPPQQGMFLECDFKGMIEPEMVKRRPVIVVSAPGLHGDGNRLATIVPLSTTEPKPKMPYHVLLKDIPVLPYFDSPEAWVKCDMIYTVSFDRLKLFCRGKDRNTGKRIYIYDCVSPASMALIQQAMLFGLGIRK